jgi:hypothetical protein
MSIFGKIMGAIFGSNTDATSPKTVPSTSATPATTAGAGPTASAPSATSPGAPTVDVALILDKAVAAKGEKLDWKASIVDLMKALDIDSSLPARKELATELGYKGDTRDSAPMNIWLHKEMMARLAANGGKLPADIKA